MCRIVLAATTQDFHVPACYLFSTEHYQLFPSFTHINTRLSLPRGISAGRSVSRHSSGIINRLSIVPKLPLFHSKILSNGAPNTAKNRVVHFQGTPCVERAMFPFVGELNRFVVPFECRICSRSKNTFAI